MPRRERPARTERSEHWLRVAINEHSVALNRRVATVFNWDSRDRIEWLSPIVSDNYAEYFDDEFLSRLGVSDLKVPLRSFWPRSGPRWDGLGKTESGKLILVEAKAYIEEGVDYSSKATSESLKQIREALARAKSHYSAAVDASWDTPFYQYANRLAHLYFARHLNGLDAYLLFLYFADAPDVPKPCTTQQWQGAERLTKKCLGLGAHPFRNHVGTIIWSVPDMLSDDIRPGTTCKMVSWSRCFTSVARNIWHQKSRGPRI
jgi:hypothetical protein